MRTSLSKQAFIRAMKVFLPACVEEILSSHNMEMNLLIKDQRFDGYLTVYLEEGRYLVEKCWYWDNGVYNAFIQASKPSRKEKKVVTVS